MPDTFEAVVQEAIARAGGLRKLARDLMRVGDVRLSPTHLANLRDGFSDGDIRVVKAMSLLYPDLGARLYVALGLPPPPQPPSSAQLPTPPGAKLIADNTTPLPLGPPVSAHDQSGFGDTELVDTLDLNSVARDRGADYLLEVAGDCLEPHISRGDWVAVKRSKTAQNGQVVVAQVMEDGFRGELGDALTLKIWRSGDPFTAGFYRADGTRVHSSSEARTVGKVVGHMRKKLPSFK